MLIKKLLLISTVCPLILSVVAAQEPSGAFTGRGLDNVAAFARLVGYVRYFYAGDAAAATDWDAFTIRYIQNIETASTPVELAQMLSELFTPRAPLIQVFPSGDQPRPISDFNLPADRMQFVTMWVHVPMGDPRVPPFGMLPGERIQVPLGTTSLSYADALYLHYANKQADILVNDPLSPIVVDLGGGVSAAIPLAVYSDDTGTLPEDSGEANSFIRPSSGDARSIRFATIVKAWNAIQHFFVYWDVIDTDWQDVLHDTLSEAGVTSDEDFLYTLQRMMAQIRDGHSFTGGESPFVLPFTWDIVEGKLVVTTLHTDQSPLAVGDIITTINGVPTAEAIAAQRQFVSPAGGYGMFHILLDLSSGRRGESITLDVDPVSAKSPFSVALEYTYRLPQAGTGGMGIRENRPNTTVWLSPDVAYVDLTRLTMGELNRFIPSLKDASAIIFDMRGYPATFGVPERLLAHLTDDPLNSPPFFIPVVTQPDHHNVNFVDVTSTWVMPNQPRLTDNVAWLINGNGTVSYAESVMGIVEGYNLGVIVGAPSAGANGNVVSLGLPNGYRTQWTGMRVTKFDGSPLFTVGITPDILVERTLAGVAAGRDELLERAFEFVSGQPANTMQYREAD